MSDKKQETQQEFNKLLELVEQGDAVAQYNLARMYFMGEEIPENKEQAMFWFTKAAEQGMEAAQTMLGLVYLSEEERKQALFWFSKAAEQRVASAQYYLGVMYFLGKGTVQDYMQAHMFANIAAANGHEKARKLRDDIAREMTAKQIIAAQKMAKEWMAKY